MKKEKKKGVHKRLYAMDKSKQQNRASHSHRSDCCPPFPFMEDTFKDVDSVLGLLLALPEGKVITVLKTGKQ